MYDKDTRAYIRLGCGVASIALLSSRPAKETRTISSSELMLKLDGSVVTLNRTVSWRSVTVPDDLQIQKFQIKVRLNLTS